MNSTLRFIKTYWLSMIVLIVILYATLASHPLPDDSLPLIPHLDKLIHAIMMGGFTGAIAFDYQRAHRNANVLTPRTILAIAAGVLVFSALDEILQTVITTNRSGDFLDLLADALGILIALLIAPPSIRFLLHLPK